MEIGYKVVRKIDGKWVSCRVHPKRIKRFAQLAHVYKIGQVTHARATSLMVFSTLKDARTFANDFNSITIRHNEEVEQIFLCTYVKGTEPTNLDGLWGTWPEGTDFASEVCLIKKIL